MTVTISTKNNNGVCISENEQCKYKVTYAPAPVTSFYFDVKTYSTSYPLVVEGFCLSSGVEINGFSFKGDTQARRV